MTWHGHAKPKDVHDMTDILKQIFNTFCNYPLKKKKYTNRFMAYFLELIFALRV